MNLLIQSLEPRRLMAVYVPDVTWGSGGQLPFLGGEHGPLVIERGGRLVATGTYAVEDGPYDDYIARFNAEGQRDRRFEQYSQYSSSDSPYLTAVDAAARPLLAESGTGSARVIRLQPAGGYDERFAGRLTPPDAVGKYVSAHGVTVMTDDNLLTVITVTGTQRKAKDRTITTYLARLGGSDGRVDPAFGTNGYLKVHESNAGAPFVPIGVEPAAAGRIYLKVGGDVFRLRPDGSRDKSVGKRGLLGSFSPEAGFRAQADGGLLLSLLDDHDYYNLTRIRPDGTTDGAFARAARAFINQGRVGDYVVLPQSDGTTYVQTKDTLRRLKADGTPDPAFDDDGVADLGHIVDDDTTIGVRGDREIIAALPGGRFLRHAGEFVYAIAPQPFAAVDDQRVLHVYGTGGDDSVAIRRENGTLRVSVNGNVLRFAGKFNSIKSDLGDGDDVYTSSVAVPNYVSGGNGHDTLVGGDAKDDFDGALGDDLIRGGGGDDNIYGGPGSDTLYGDDGDDTLYPGDYGFDEGNDNAPDRVDGGRGQDLCYRPEDDVDVLIRIEKP